MTRSEFSLAWWNYCVLHNAWYTAMKGTCAEFERVWWQHPTGPSWRLTDFGHKHLSKLTKFVSHRQSWEMLVLHTPSLLMKTKKLQCAWYVKAHSDRNGKSYFTELTLFGEKEIVWMTLCGGDLEQFLNTWTVDNTE